jgi:peptide chain release factor 1
MDQLPDNLLRKLDELRAEWTSLGRELEDPLIAVDHRRTRAIAMRRSAIEPIATAFTRWRALPDEAASLQELLDSGDPELATMAKADLAGLAIERSRLADTLQEALVTAGDRAVGNLILEVRAGVGGDEAGLWAGDLCSMYLKFAQRRGWRVEELESKTGDAGGVSQAIFAISGTGCWSDLGYEGGTHQVKRVPATEAQGRVHTSTATVAVLPEPEDVESAVDPAEVKEMVTTAQGPGGQNVNKVATAVHLIHLPTGIEVRMQETRSQGQNREKAWKLLRARVLERREAEAAARRSDQRIAMIGSGGRAEKIRTYRWKENLAVDHRIERSFPLHGLLAGELEPMVGALRAADIAERIKAL